MIRQVLIAFLLGCAGFAGAQSFAAYERYFLTELVYNPAAAGTNDDVTAVITSRSSWLGIERSPRLNMLNVHLKASDIFSRPRDFIGDKLSRIGLGLGAFHDRHGLMTTMGVQFSLAWHTRLSSSSRLSFGISPRFYQVLLAEDRFRATDPGDPDLSFNAQTALFSNFNAGLFLRSGNLRAGVSASNLMPLFSNNEHFYQFDQKPSGFLTVRYNLAVTEKIGLEPSLILRSDGNNHRADAMLRAQIGRVISIGAGFATTAAYSCLFAIRANKLVIGYVFENVQSPLTRRVGANHTFFVGSQIWQ